MNGQSESRYTVWHVIGCGCSVLLVLALIAAAAVIFFGKQMVDGVRAGIEDPEVRAARTREILGYDELPEGYHPGFSVSVPFVMDMASLGDREPPAGEEMGDEGFEEELEKGFGGAFFERRGFLFMKVRALGDEPPEGEFQGELDLDIQIQRRIDEGTLEAGGAEVDYTAHLGYGLRDGERMPTLSTELDIRCLSAPYMRKAVWFTPGPEEEVPVGELDPEVLRGTAADPEAIKAFLDHFDLCR